MINNLILALLILLTSCKGNWGDKFYTFVDNDSERISTNYAQSLFKKKWNQAFNDFSILSRDRILLSINLAESLEVKSFEDGISEKEIMKRYKQHIKSLVLLLDFESSHYDLGDEIKKIKNLCNDKQAFYHLGLNSDALKGMLRVNLPQREEMYYISTDYLETAFYIISDVFSSNDHKEQANRFNAGIDLIEHKVVKDENLFEISQSVCEPVFQNYRKIIEDISTSYLKVQKFITKKRASLYKSLSILEIHVLAIGRERIAQRYGLEDFFNKVDQFKNFNFITRRLDHMYLKWQELKISRYSVNNIEERLRKEDELYYASKKYLSELSILESKVEDENLLSLILQTKSMILRYQKRLIKKRGYDV